jgi:hypothetical protein
VGACLLKMLLLRTEAVYTSHITQQYVQKSTMLWPYSSVPHFWAFNIKNSLYTTLRYSTLLYATLRYSMLLYATLRYSTLLYATLRYSTLLYATRIQLVEMF